MSEGLSLGVTPNGDHVRLSVLTADGTITLDFSRELADHLGQRLWVFGCHANSFPDLPLDAEEGDIVPTVNGAVEGVGYPLERVADVRDEGVPYFRLAAVILGAQLGLSYRGALKPIKLFDGHEAEGPPGQR